MSNVPERLHADPPAREAPSVHVDGSDSEGVVLELLLARFDRQEEKLERVGAELERVREENVETRAELTATRRALAELTVVVKSINPTFDVNEQLASVVFSHVTDVRTRVALSLVNTVWRGASKVASSLPAWFDYNLKMLEWYKKGARHGNTECEMMLGRLYEDGDGVKKDIPKAIEWFEKAAAKGDADAQNSAGIYHSWKGRYDEAFKWYTKAAAQGHAAAEYNLGFLYDDGRGVKKDISKAIEWYAKAAAKGHAAAQNNVGLCHHEKGQHEEAFKWCSKSAAQGHAFAECSLGSLYEDGDGGKKDISKAIEWYAKAAEKGHALAAERLRTLTPAA